MREEVHAASVRERQDKTHGIDETGTFNQTGTTGQKEKVDQIVNRRLRSRCELSLSGDTCRWHI